MRGSVSELALAQGVREQYEGLQALRRHGGLKNSSALARLPRALKGDLLQIRDDSPAELESGMRRLLQLVDQAPTQERALLRLSLNIDEEFGDRSWVDRSNVFAESSESLTNGGSVRHHADLALLQLVMRAQPAAEARPAPEDQVEPNAQHTSLITVEQFFDQDYVRNSPGFVKAWQEASTVDMCGFGHNRMLVSYSAELIELLSRGGSLRILLQDPESGSVLDANKRSSTPKASDEAVRHQHRAGLATIAALGRAAGCDVELLRVRVYDILPPFTGYFFDASEEHALAFIWFWSWRQPSAWRPGFSVARSSDPVWFDRFYSQFEALWNDEQVTTEIQTG